MRSRVSSSLVWKLCTFLVILIAIYKFVVILYAILWKNSYPLRVNWSSSIIDSITRDSYQSLTTKTKNEDFPEVVIVGRNQKAYTNQQSRKVAIESKDFYVSSKLGSETKIIFLATPFHGMWSPDHYYALQIGKESFEKYSCPYRNCLVTKDAKYSSTADAVVFHLRDITIDGFQFARGSNQKWILHTLEPPWLEFNNLEMLEGVFNWTMSYRMDSDIVVRYGFIGRRNDTDLVETSRAKVNSFDKRKKAAVWFVSDCCTFSGRENYVRELKRYMEVDVFGGCGRDVCRPAETSACYETVMMEYLFYLSFENAICKDYVTEKFFNILNYEIVPVVFGGVNYEDIAPARSYINTANFSSPKALATYLNYLAMNETLYRTYFYWKHTSTAYMSPWTCDLCKKLHENASTHSTRNDLKKWFVNDAQCQRWTKHGFSSKQYTVFPCYKRKIF